MTGSALQEYARGILSHVPWMPWSVMGVVSLALTVILLIRKRCSVYGAIALGLTLEFSRLFQKSGQRHIESIANIAVFVPFGFFLAEFLAATKRLRPWRRIGWVVLAAFGLSLCIECLQLLLRVGFFELTDLVMNAVGGGVGAGVSVGWRKLVAADES